jgi:hypothetical protein
MILHWFTIVGLAFMAVVGLVAVVPQAIRLWRNQGSCFDTAPPVWPWGPAAWPAFRRSIVAQVIFVLPMVMAILAVGLDIGRDECRAAVKATAVPICAVIVAIAFFNRPKLLVPPHLRTEPGFFKDLLGSHSS